MNNDLLGKLHNVNVIHLLFLDKNTLFSITFISVLLGIGIAIAEGRFIA